MRPPRLRIRTLMIAVAVAALLTWGATIAWESSRPVPLPGPGWRIETRHEVP